MTDKAAKQAALRDSLKKAASGSHPKYLEAFQKSLNADFGYFLSVVSPLFYSEKRGSSEVMSRLLTDKKEQEAMAYLARDFDPKLSDGLGTDVSTFTGPTTAVDAIRIVEAVLEATLPATGAQTPGALAGTGPSSVSSNTQLQKMMTKATEGKDNPMSVGFLTGLCETTHPEYAALVGIGKLTDSELTERLKNDQIKTKSAWLLWSVLAPGIGKLYSEASHLALVYNQRKLALDHLGRVICNGSGGAQRKHYHPISNSPEVKAAIASLMEGKIVQANFSIVASKMSTDQIMSAEDAEKVAVRNDSGSLAMVVHPWGRSLGNLTMVARFLDSLLPCIFGLIADSSQLFTMLMAIGAADRVAREMRDQCVMLMIQDVTDRFFKRFQKTESLSLKFIPSKVGDVSMWSKRTEEEYRTLITKQEEYAIDQAYKPKLDAIKSEERPVVEEPSGRREGGHNGSGKRFRDHPDDKRDDRNNKDGQTLEKDKWKKPKTNHRHANTDSEYTLDDLPKLTPGRFAKRMRQVVKKWSEITGQDKSQECCMGRLFDKPCRRPACPSAASHSLAQLEAEDVRLKIFNACRGPLSP